MFFSDFFFWLRKANKKRFMCGCGASVYVKTEMRKENVFHIFFSFDMKISWRMFTAHKLWLCSSSIVYLSWSFGWLLHGDGNVLSLEILKRERVGGSLIERWKCFSRLGWRVEMASLYTSCRHV